MFKVGQNVYSQTSGVCVISSIEEKNFGVGEIKYFVLESIFKKQTSKTYIPVDKADVQLRTLITKNEAKKLLKYIAKAEKVWENDPKQRRQMFEDMYKSKDLKSRYQLIKSLHLQNEELKKQKKSLSMLDKDFFDKIQRDIVEELSLVLEVSLEEARKTFEKALI